MPHDPVAAANAAAVTVAAATLTGTDGPDVLKGGTGDDVLNGLGGNDYLNGDGGTDSMSGGTGNDYFVVDNPGDITFENPGEGQDSVEASISWTLGTNLEYLNLVGTAPIDGTGNALANVLRGNGAANTLRGLDGNDTLDGKAGNDRLEGGAGADTMTGGPGADAFVVGRGLGHDTVVDFTHGEDKIVVLGFTFVQSIVQQGADALVILSDTDSVLLRNVDRSTLTNSDFQFGLAPPPPPPPPPTGGVTLNGTDGNDVLKGGTGADTLNGLGGNDYLNGGPGADLLRGGTGNDYFVVDQAGDSVVELPGEGSDSVEASISWTLGANLEYLNLSGSAAISGTGNSLNNVIRGNAADNSLSGLAGNDSLEGRAGNDSLAGGAGTDSFVFRPGSGTDTVTDWQDGIDHLDFFGFGGSTPTITQVGANTEIHFATGETVILAGVQASTIGASDLIFH
jgi:Ca2+-binding RTX toxin-like protein